MTHDPLGVGLSDDDAVLEAEDSERPASGGDDTSGQLKNLTSLIKDLEGQLDAMISTNDALSKDLDDERQRRIASEGTIDDLKERLRRSESEVADKENLLAEISHLSQERARLEASVGQLERKLEGGDTERRKQAAIIERLRSVQSDALEEVQSVEAQFERALQLVTDTRAQLAVVTEERNALGGRIKATERRLAEVQEERDALFAEVDESRVALDEIRRSLVDAVVDAAGVTKEAAAAGGRQRQPDAGVS